MKRSESIDKLTTALAKAQAAMEGAAKDSNNPFFKSKYADLASCWAAWRPAGPPNGLALMQFATAVEERLDPPIQVQADGDRKAKTIHFIQRVSIETILAFEDQWVSETLTLLVKDDSPQSTLLGETYGRRGAMCAMIGIAPEDDDGNTASGAGEESGERRTARETMPVCPQCSVNLHVIKGKEEYGGGYVCYTKKGGCGAKWSNYPLPQESNVDPKNIAGVTTADKLPPKKSGVMHSTYETGLDLIARANSHELVETADAWVVKQWDKKLLKVQEYADLTVRACDRMLTVTQFSPDIKRVEAFIREVSKMPGRLSEGDYLAYGGKIADLDEKLAQTAGA